MPALGLDASTSIAEDQWFRGGENWDMLHNFCASWVGERRWSCLDVYSASGKIASTFRKGGHEACSFDIKSDPAQDVTSRAGFLLLLRLGMELL